MPMTAMAGLRVMPARTTVTATTVVETVAMAAVETVVVATAETVVVAMAAATERWP